MSEYYLLFPFVILAAVVLAILHNKRDQKKVMDYYTQGTEDSKNISSQSLENQKRMIAILEEISRKLDK